VSTIVIKCRSEERKETNLKRTTTENAIQQQQNPAESALFCYKMEVAEGLVRLWWQPNADSDQIRIMEVSTPLETRYSIQQRIGNISPDFGTFGFVSVRQTEGQFHTSGLSPHRCVQFPTVAQNFGRAEIDSLWFKSSQSRGYRFPFLWWYLNWGPISPSHGGV